MKFVFTVLSIIAFSTVFAQLKEGKIVYDINVDASDPQMEMVVTMMEGSTTEIIFNDEYTVSTTSMGSMQTTTAIYNHESEEMLMLMSGMMGKMAVKSSKEDLKEGQEDEEEVEVELLDEEKVIAGYTCKKAIVSTDEDDVEVWYTDELDVKQAGSGNGYKGVPGMALEYTIIQNGLTMVFTTTSITKELTSSDLEKMTMEIPEGYKEMTMDQLKAMGGGR